LQEARQVGEELSQVTAVLGDLGPERTVALVERLIDVAADAAKTAGLVPEMERAVRCRLAPAPVRRRVLADLIDALRHDSPGLPCTKARHLVVA
jgi:hypothetical protein